MKSVILLILSLIMSIVCITVTAILAESKIWWSLGPVIVCDILSMISISCAISDLFDERGNLNE